MRARDEHGAHAFGQFVRISRLGFLKALDRVIDGFVGGLILAEPFVRLQPGFRAA
jgi:hypothetical protein